MKGLIADIGATNARFALADDQGFHAEKILACDDYPNLDDAIAAYLDAIGERVSRAAIAMAGPVSGDWFEMTNNPWKFSVEDVRKKIGLESFHLLNDFEAIAMAIPHIQGEHLVKIGGGEKIEKRTIGVIGPGTGLGVASLFWDGEAYRPNPCEGGHVTMAAKTQREFDIFRTLRYKYSHVSAERVCSGKGLTNVYNAIRILDGRDDLPADLDPALISAKAQDGSCPVCVESLDKMMAFLGTIASNLAVSLGAMGGVYIAGGIPAKLGGTFLNSRFRTEFESKGRMSDYLATIPTYLITHPMIAFVGLQADLHRQK
jgi:glucokinase